MLAAAALTAAGFGPRPPAAADGPLTLDVMTFNIRYGTAADGADEWSARRQSVIDLIERHGPDVLGLQEALAFQLAEIAEGVEGYARVGVGRDDGLLAGEFSAILYDADRLLVDRSGTFWLSDTPSVPASSSWGNGIPRICTWARFVDARSGRAFWVYNTHFDHRSQASRERAAAAIVAHAAERTGREPLVVMGDLNAGPDNPAVRLLLSQRRGEPALKDVVAGTPDAEAGGTFTGFDPESDGGTRIDWVLVSEAAAVTGASIVRDRRPDGRWPSDHFPVRATVTFGDAGEAGD